MRKKLGRIRKRSVERSNIRSIDGQTWENRCFRPIYDRCIPKIFVYGVAEEFMNQLTPIFESLRQKEDLPCSYPLHMHAPSYHWVNKKTLSTLLISAVDGVTHIVLSDTID